MRIKKTITTVLGVIPLIFGISFINTKAQEINSGEEYEHCLSVSEEKDILMMEEKELLVGSEDRENNEKPIKETVYNADGSIDWYHTFEYDGNGNMTKETEYNVDGSIGLYYIYEYEYDSNGNEVKKTGYNADGSIDWYYTKEYDSNGNEIKETGYRRDGSIYYYYIYEYDSNGNEIKEIHYNADGGISSYNTYEYDSNRNEIKEIHYNADGSVYSYCVYEYDRNGNVIKLIEYDGDGNIDGYNTYEYDSNGNEIKGTSYRWDGSIYSYYVYEYDRNGNIIKAIHYYADGSIEYYNILEYDSLDDEKEPDSKTQQKYAEIPPNYYSKHEGNYFYKDINGNVTCLDSNGKTVINDFKCDGEFTYFFQADGTAMKDRLTYHPDGEHVIYFDSEGHEVFSDFANVKKTIAGDEVDDYCFFDVFGYMYVDVVTYDKTGTVLYYANAYGVMEMGKWFQFSDKVTWADGRDGNEFKNQYGCANADGTLITNTQTIDWEGRSCYLQGNGVALY